MFLIAENIIQIIFLILSFSMNSWSSDGSFLNDLFILNESLMWFGNNESSRDWFVLSRMRNIL